MKSGLCPQCGRLVILSYHVMFGLMHAFLSYGQKHFLGATFDLFKSLHQSLWMFDESFAENLPKAPGCKLNKRACYTSNSSATLFLLVQQKKFCKEFELLRTLIGHKQKISTAKQLDKMFPVCPIV